jgi:phosphocarrier protein HPr
MIEKQCTITVKVGLHARPANEFAAIAKSAPCEILVGKPGEPLVKGNSPLRLLTLKAHEGDSLVLQFDTNDEILAEDLYAKLLATITE